MLTIIVILIISITIAFNIFVITNSCSSSSRTISMFFLSPAVAVLAALGAAVAAIGRLT